MKKPLLISLFASIFITALIVSARVDPVELFTSSYNKFNYTTYTLQYNMLMRLSMLGTDIDYTTVYTLSKSGNKVSYDSYTQAPFSFGKIRNSMYMLDSGNYTCTDEYGVSACYPLNISLNDLFIQEFLNSSMLDNVLDVKLLGKKTINNINCNYFEIHLNNSDISFDQDLNKDFVKINSFKMFLCINEKTGVVAESSVAFTATLRDPNSTLSYDVGYNITQTLLNYSFDVSEDAFKLPYQVMSYEEYEKLLFQHTH